MEYRVQVIITNLIHALYAINQLSTLFDILARIQSQIYHNITHIQYYAKYGKKFYKKKKNSFSVHSTQPTKKAINDLLSKFNNL